MHYLCKIMRAKSIKSHVQKMKQLGKHTLFGWGWRILMWLVLTSVVLFVLLALLIYFPPVQKWAVGEAADWLSEEMNMDVKVENVRLKFPLDLSMGGVLAVQEGDTVLSAEELQLSVQPRPLFDGVVNVDEVVLRNADVNTRGLIDAILIKGHVGELAACTHGVDLEKERIVVNDLTLRNSGIYLSLPDTVPPDTIEKEPAKWKISMEHILLDQVEFGLLLPQGKGYSIDDLYSIKSVANDLDTYFGKAELRANIDLENGTYSVGNLHSSETVVRFQNAFDAKDIDVACDSVCFVQEHTNLFVDVNKLSGSESCGMNFEEVRGKVLMDSVRLVLPEMAILTDDSEMTLSLDMPLDTWNEENPGEMLLTLQSVLGRSDVLSITKYVDRFMPEDGKLDAVRDMVKEYMPVRPTPLNVNVSGNLKDLKFDNVYARVDGIGRIEGSARMRGDELSADVRGQLHGGDLAVDGKYNLANEEYDAKLKLQNFNVNKHVSLSEPLVLTGAVAAKGRGFDPFSKSTQIDAVADIEKGYYGKIDLTTVNADIQLRNEKAKMNVSCSNSQLDTDFCLIGLLRKDVADGSLDIDLRHADLNAMGLSDSTLVVKMAGQFDVFCNLKDQFRIDSYVGGIDVKTNSGRIHTDDFDLFAESTSANTTARLKSGDLMIDFEAPDNILKVMKKGERLNTAFAKQTKDRALNFDLLRTYMPQAKLKAKASRNNPLYAYLETNGVKFSELTVNLDASPEVGLVGAGHINALQKDSTLIENVFFDIHQDAENIVFNAGIECNDQPMFSAFRANLNGYLGSRVADVHLDYYDKRNVKGVDIGAHVEGLDSVWRLTMYPEKPILAYRQFELADTSYIDFYREKGHPIVGDVKLRSLEDNCNISLVGIDNEGEQRALVEVNDFNLEGLASVMPMLPKMQGMFSVDAAYQEVDDKFWVDGIMDIANFTYEGMKVGNIGSLFTYEPEGANKHKLEGDISYEGVDVVTLDGAYNASGEGYLDANLELLNIPMKMLSPFVPDQMVAFNGSMAGNVSLKGATDRLMVNGYVLPNDVHALFPYYSVDLRLANDSVMVKDSKIEFNKYGIFGSGDNPIEMTGNVDFSNFDNIPISLSLVGRNIQLVDSKRTRKSVLFGNAFGDVFARISGTSNDISVRGALNVLNTTNVTYIMAETALSQGDRLDDIVTFVDFSLPPDSSKVVQASKIMGVDMNMRLTIQEGARVRCEFSADRQSYVNVRGGGSLSMTYTPQGIMNVQGRLVVNEGEMKYTLPVIPLKTFTLSPGSSVDFNGDLYNPTLNITATSRTKAAVSTENSSTKSVAFDVGLKITNTLNDMGLAFTIDAPEDAAMQDELNNYTDEEKSKLAVALLATGMYVADNNTSALNANTALSTFLQSELNNITGRALNSIVDVSLGMDQTTYSDGSTGTDYSFKFSKRFFSDRLSVVIGGRVSDNKTVNEATGIGSFIDDVSLEWRIDPAGSRSVRLFHNKDYNNIFEGVLEKNGAGVVLRKKMDSLSELIFWKRKKE